MWPSHSSAFEYKTMKTQKIIKLAATDHSHQIAIMAMTSKYHENRVQFNFSQGTFVLLFSSKHNPVSLLKA